MSGMVTITANPSLDTTAVADRVEPDRKIRCRDADRDPGGGGLNVARAVQILGGAATAVWARGRVFGAIVGDALDAAGLDHVPVDVAGETRQCFAVIERDSDRHFRFSMPGPALRRDELEALAAAVVERSPDLVVISGGLPPDVPPGFYADLARAAAGEGARVVVDTHGEPLQQVLATGCVFLVKPNYRELYAAIGVVTDGSEPEVGEAARRLVGDADLTAVLVSLGAGGAVLVTRDGEERITAPTVPIRSRIGAGDSMVGGLSWRLTCGDELSRAARYGVAAGAAATMTPGTELCRADDVTRLFAVMEQAVAP